MLQMAAWPALGFAPNAGSYWWIFTFMCLQAHVGIKLCPQVLIGESDFYDGIVPLHSILEFRIIWFHYFSDTDAQHQAVCSAHVSQVAGRLLHRWHANRDHSALCWEGGLWQGAQGLCYKRA